MKSPTRFVAARALVAGAALLVLASTALAQEGRLEVADPAQVPQAPRPAQPPAGLEPSYWALNSGFEGDSHETGYGFFGPTYHKPIRENLQFVAGGNVNYLYYEFPSGGGRTNVRSPGVSTKAGLRFGDRNWFQVTGGPSFKRKQREIRNASDTIISSESDIEPGFSLGADTWINPSRRNNIHGMFHYGTEDGYIWSRVGFKQQVSNFSWRNSFSHYVGGEFIGQGNEDIRSNQIGALFELLHAPSSVSFMFRAGYKHSSFDVGADKTGPYVAVSFYKSIGRQ